MNKNEYPIDLGKPMSSGMVAMPEKSSKKEKYYPSIYLDWDDKYDLPDSGVMEVRFKKRSETNRTQEGKTSQSVDLEILEILDVESDDSDAKTESGDKALDRYRNEGGK